jgi:hypothetical protein
MRLETKAEARGHDEIPDNKHTAAWVDDAPRWDGRRAWMLLPYIDALDQVRLNEQLQIGRDLVQSIRERLKTRELSASFLHDWGRFRAAAGVLEFLFFSEPSVGHLRSALAGGNARIEEAEAHRRWFAHYFLRAYRRGRRGDAEKVVERLIVAIIDGTVGLPSGYRVKWFEDYLDLKDTRAPTYATLKPAFNEHSLSVAEMKKLKATGSEGIPPIDLEIPDP